MSKSAKYKDYKEYKQMTTQNNNSYKFHNYLIFYLHNTSYGKGNNNV
jgi:hypothetical protein